VPFLFSWPSGLGGVDGQRRQYVHVTDILPTLLDLVGVEAPTHRHGQALKPLVGTTFAPTLTDADAPSDHNEQHYENLGHRGYYRDGWEVVTLHQPMSPFSDEEWELYHLPSDPTELRDLAHEQPDRLNELAALWEEAAWANQVYPLDEGSSIRYLVRPPWAAVYGEPVTLVPGTPTLERWRSVQLIWFRAFRITAEVDFVPGDQGYLVAHGDQGSGYGLYVLDDELVFVHNDGRGRMRRLSAGGLTPGACTLTADFSAPGKNVWDLRLLVDDVERSQLDGVPMLYGMAPFEGLDVGIDRRSPVDWDIYESFGPFAYTGALHRVRVEPGEPAHDSPQNMIDLIREMGARFE
jgi:arylsulfatase